MVKFEDYISDAEFNTGFNRYGYYYNYGFIITAEFCPVGDQVKNLVDDLSGGDIEASDAINKLMEMRIKGQIFMEWSELPDIAMSNIVKEIKKYKSTLDKPKETV